MSENDFLLNFVEYYTARRISGADPHAILADWERSVGRHDNVRDWFYRRGHAMSGA